MVVVTVVDEALDRDNNSTAVHARTQDTRVACARS